MNTGRDLVGQKMEIETMQAPTLAIAALLREERFIFRLLLCVEINFQDLNRG